MHCCPDSDSAHRFLIQVVQEGVELFRAENLVAIVQSSEERVGVIAWLEIVCDFMNKFDR